MNKGSVLDTPLRFTRDDNMPVVVIYAPDGHRIVLSASAAMRSARELARAAKRAARRGDPAAVVSGHFNWLRNLPQRRWQSWRAGRPSFPLRAEVAVLLLPLATGIGTAVFIALTLLLGAATALHLIVWAPLAGLIAAVPLGWLGAILLIDHEELASRPPRGSRPRLVASDPALGGHK